ncbi:hypothetical protein AcV7_002155 [Taiwanofungus camphoratus]|nr:hypothetical protein AcV7_002155 [Antrodia cinnamomea]
MEKKRAKTLEALSTFIESQKALLNRTLNDIERLHELRREVATSSNGELESINDKLNATSCKLSEQADLVVSLPEDIDWSQFKHCDPTPLKELASSSRNAYEQHNRPSTTQKSEPSELQKLVREARASIIDPFLASLDPLSELSDEEEEAPDSEELKRAREREKIRELKKRRIDRASAAPVFSGLRRPRAVNGVFIRRDQEDESAEVDIFHSEMVGDADGERSILGSGSETVPIDVDTPPTSVTSPGSIISSLPPSGSTATERPVRERRPTRKAQAGIPLRTRGEKDSSAPEFQIKRERDGVDALLNPTAVSSPQGPEEQAKGRPKSDTYKQAWSVSEQHLLERLLEEIPDGEKNRWAKISKAMNGRRTARQVASRVQKYFEKLKRFGVDMGVNKSNQGME